MATVNKVMLLGNVTRDIELKYTPSNMAVCELGLALNDSYKDRAGNKVEKAVFVDVTLWGKTAEIAAEYLSKGSPVHIEGKLSLDQWDDKESGKKRSKLKVTGERLQLLGSRGKDDQRPKNTQSYGEEPQANPDPVFPGDDVPF